SLAKLVKLPHKFLICASRCATSCFSMGLLHPHTVDSYSKWLSRWRTRARRTPRRQRTLVSLSPPRRYLRRGLGCPCHPSRIGTLQSRFLASERAPERRPR